MNQPLKIGTRDSELAVWQATLVKNLLQQNNVEAELVFIKSEGDIDLVTPLYELGVQGIFTKTLDIALLNKRIDIAVHSMKDVPTQPARGIVTAAILKRASYKDILVYNGDSSFLEDEKVKAVIATSSVRRKAQWLHKFPDHQIENLRGNVNTRLRKVKESNWNGAIFAAAGLERINLRPRNSIDLEWMLPAPSQGAIMIVCREEDEIIKEQCFKLNDAETAMCTKIEKDFLRVLMGGCSTPISALAVLENNKINFRGNICSLDGKEIIEIKKEISTGEVEHAGSLAAEEILQLGGASIIEKIRNTNL